MFVVYRAEFSMTVPDPDMPSPRYHNVIFVENNPNQSGVIHHVIGDLVMGMVYDQRPSQRPELEDTFVKKERLGTVHCDDYPTRMEHILRAQRSPQKQKAFNIQTMRTEQTKADGTFFMPGEPRPPMIKCTEWVVNQAIPALYAAGVIRPDTGGKTNFEVEPGQP